MSISKRGKAAIEARKAADKAEEDAWAARSGPVETHYIPMSGPRATEDEIKAALDYIQARYGALNVDTSPLEV
jgi:hypothetical protein